MTNSTASNSDITATRPEDRVPFAQKLAVGIGGVPWMTGTQIFQKMAQPVYVIFLGVNPLLIGIALTIPRLWDAFVDPVVGAISDNFRSRFGRRKPFIVVGSVLVAVSFMAIWMVPRDWSQYAPRLEGMGQGLAAFAGWFGVTLDAEKMADPKQWANFLYLTVTGLVFYTCYSIFSVPLSSLTYEMTPDSTERNRVMAYWAFFTTVGGFLLNSYYPLAATKEGAIPLPFGWGAWEFSLFPDSLSGAWTVSLIVGIVIFIGLGMLPGLFGHERFYHVAQKQEKIALLPAIGQTLRNRAMLMLLGIQLTLAFAGALADGLALYLVIYYVCLGNETWGAWLNALNGYGFQIVGFVAIPIMAWLATRLGKRRAMFAILWLTLVGSIAKWFIYTPSAPYLLLLDAVLSGPIWVALMLLVPSMLADLCDVDEYQYGKRREGIFGAVFSWMQKTGSSLTFLVSGLALTLSGFDADRGAAQPDETIFIMRACFAGASIIASVACLLFLYFYNVSEQRAHEVRRLLEERRGRL